MRNMEKRYSAIIVAAGTGKRMNSSVKKQYITISGFPVLYYTIKAFEESKVDDIIIVTGSDEIEYVKNDIVDKYGFNKIRAVCAGGRERCDSVYKGLQTLMEKTVPGYILIHDGVRPMITPSLINTCVEKVTEYEAVIPAIPEKDTVKEVNADMEVAGTPDRKKLYRIQTPQCFKMELIGDAFEKFYKASGRFTKTGENTEEAGVSDSAAITDDAMLVEKFTGHKIKIIEGDYKNIKITTPEDIALAEFYLM